MPDLTLQLRLPDQLTPAQVAASTGATVHSVRRWMRHGIRSPQGRPLRLQSRRIGGRFVTCQAWLGDFLAALNPPSPDAMPVIQSPAAMRRAEKAARKELARMLGRQQRTTAI
jgi:hypothetical protein